MNNVIIVIFALFAGIFLGKILGTALAYYLYYLKMTFPSCAKYFFWLRK